MSDAHNIITCAKFQIEIFIGYDFIGGGQIFDFPIDFSMGSGHFSNSAALMRCFSFVGKPLMNRFDPNVTWWVMSGW